VTAVLLDLDDTLFDQSQWLDGAWEATSLAAVPFDVEPTAFASELRAVCALGSWRGRIIDRALARLGREDVPVAPLLKAFLSYRAECLDPYPGVPAALAELGARHRLALITDGAPDGQRDKLRALGLQDAFDVVVLSDLLGRAHRKPSPRPFQTALSLLGVPRDAALMVGDRPDKDVLGATRAGLAAVRVRTGEHRLAPDDPPAWAVVDDLPSALPLIDARLRAAGGPCRASAAAGAAPRHWG
jgi:putative hydrolase of the HAD superfamily